MHMPEPEHSILFHGFLQWELIRCGGVSAVRDGLRLNVDHRMVLFTEQSTSPFFHVVSNVLESHPEFVFAFLALVIDYSAIKCFEIKCLDSESL